VPIIELDLLTNYIQKYINEAPYKANGKKGTGLSYGRIKNIKLFASTINRYEAEVFKGKSILIKNINLKFAEDFKSWLFNQNYSINYVGKNIANLKTICFDAQKNDIETSTQLQNIKGLSENKAPEQIIYLSEAEQEQIKNANLLRESLINARKWLLLGCLIGQRGGDLLNITENNIKDLNGIKIIELKQQKTGKLVAIPLLPDAVEIIESGIPYKISLTKFNEYIKEVCQEAGINEPITGKIKVTSRNPLKVETKPKYNFITSHVCRRSFASVFYGRIPTPVLMNITAHGTEKVFLHYIGKTTYDNAYQMIDYFSKLAPKGKTPIMDVIRNTQAI
jgi:integrase